jgi:hypothetical protein
MYFLDRDHRLWNPSNTKNALLNYKKKFIEAKEVPEIFEAMHYFAKTAFELGDDEDPNYRDFDDVIGYKAN